MSKDLVHDKQLLFQKSFLHKKMSLYLDDPFNNLTGVANKSGLKSKLIKGRC